MESHPAEGSSQPIIEQLVLGPFAANCYIVRDPSTAEAIIVDPAAEADLLVSRVSDYKPQKIILTHGHLDHVGVCRTLKNRLGIPIGLHPFDAALAQIVPDFHPTEGEPIILGNLTIAVLHTPGHTPGSISLVVQNEALVGDLIFPGGPGVTRTPTDFDQILRSITSKILTLSPETRLHPGHGQGFTVSQARQEVADFLHRPAKTRLCGEVRWENG